MRTLEPIAALRRKGYKPAHVVLTDTRTQLDCYVHYERNEAPELVDLRPLIGLFVTVEGTDAQMVERWAKAAMQAQANTVLSMVYERRGDDIKARWTDYRVNGITA